MRVRVLPREALNSSLSLVSIVLLGVRVSVRVRVGVSCHLSVSFCSNASLRRRILLRGWVVVGRRGWQWVAVVLVPGSEHPVY